MTKFAIGNPNQIKRDPAPTHFWLEKIGDDIVVRMSNEDVVDGAEMYLAKVTSSGLFRFDAIPHGYGFTTEGGRIAIVSK